MQEAGPPGMASVLFSRVYSELMWRAAASFVTLTRRGQSREGHPLVLTRWAVPGKKGHWARLRAGAQALGPQWLARSWGGLECTLFSVSPRLCLTGLKSSRGCWGTWW